MTRDFDKWNAPGPPLQGTYCTYPGWLGDFQVALLRCWSLWSMDHRFGRTASRVLWMPGQLLLRGKGAMDEDPGYRKRAILLTDYFLAECPGGYTYHYDTASRGRQAKVTDVLELTVQELFYTWLHAMRSDPVDLPLLAVSSSPSPSVSYGSVVSVVSGVSGVTGMADWSTWDSCSVWAGLRLQGVDISMGLGECPAAEEVLRGLDGHALTPHHRLELAAREREVPLYPPVRLVVRYTP